MGSPPVIEFFPLFFEKGVFGEIFYGVVATFGNFMLRKNLHEVSRKRLDEDDEIDDKVAMTSEFQNRVFLNQSGGWLN